MGKGRIGLGMMDEVGRAMIADTPWCFSCCFLCCEGSSMGCLFIALLLLLCRSEVLLFLSVPHLLLPQCLACFVFLSHILYLDSAAQPASIPSKFTSTYHPISRACSPRNHYHHHHLSPAPLIIVPCPPSIRPSKRKALPAFHPPDLPPILPFPISYFLFLPTKTSPASAFQG